MTTTLGSGANATWLLGRMDPDYRFPEGTLEQIRPFVSTSGLATLSRPISPAFASRLRERLRIDQGNVAAMVRNGILVAAGTDTGPLDLRLDLELQLLVQAGLTPLQAIRTATLDAARCARIDSEVGSVEVGKRADLILVRGDPSKDVEALSHIEAVVLGGRLHERSELMRSPGAPSTEPAGEQPEKPPPRRNP